MLHVSFLFEDRIGRFNSEEAVFNDRETSINIVGIF